MKFILLMCICLCLIVTAVAVRCLFINKPGTQTITVSSLLTDAIDIAELYTSEYKYRGIAEIYSNEEKTDLRCRVCYNAIVKAGVNMNDVQLDVNQFDKTVIIGLPEINLDVAIIDEETMQLLPSNVDVSVEEILRCSREDVEMEANKSSLLMDTARETLQTSIEGVLFPLVKAQGYTIIWQ